MTYTVAQLVAVGGREWQRGDMHRVYFNDLAAVFGLTYDGWKYTIDGEIVSNNTGRSIAAQLANGKFWYDLVTGEFVGKDLHEKSIAKLTERIAAMAATNEAAEAEVTDTPMPAAETPVIADVRTASGYGIPARQVRTNIRPGRCRKCGQWVLTGEGHAYYIDPDEAYEDSGWIVEHIDTCPTVAEDALYG